MCRIVIAPCSPFSVTPNLMRASAAFARERGLMLHTHMSAEEALWLGTRGGAAVLGRDEIGYLGPGMAADLIGVRLDRLAFAGAQADPPAALPFRTPPTVNLSIINGRVVFKDGRLLGLELSETMAHHNKLALELLGSADHA
jgi:8-oxoguanine deaminase